MVLNKDGSFQRSARFRGPDLESATEAELVATCARINNVLRRFGAGWALFFEAARHAAGAYPHSRFPDPLSRLVDAERRAAFEAEGAHFESTFTLTLVWLPPAESVGRAGTWLLETPGDKRGLDYRDHLASFVAQTDRALDLLAAIMPEVEPLTGAEVETKARQLVAEYQFLETDARALVLPKPVELATRQPTLADLDAAEDAILDDPTLPESEKRRRIALLAPWRAIAEANGRRAGQTRGAKP